MNITYPLKKTKGNIEKMIYNTVALRLVASNEPALQKKHEK